MTSKFFTRNLGFATSGLWICKCLKHMCYDCPSPIRSATTTTESAQVWHCAAQKVRTCRKLWNWIALVCNLRRSWLQESKPQQTARLSQICCPLFTNCIYWVNLGMGREGETPAQIFWHIGVKKKWYKLSKLGGGGGVEVIWTKSKRTATFFSLEAFPKSHISRKKSTVCSSQVFIQPGS